VKVGGDRSRERIEQKREPREAKAGQGKRRARARLEGDGLWFSATISTPLVRVHNGRVAMLHCAEKKRRKRWKTMGRKEGERSWLVEPLVNDRNTNRSIETPTCTLKKKH